MLTARRPARGISGVAMRRRAAMARERLRGVRDGVPGGALAARLGPRAPGYLAAALGVALASLVIAALRRFLHVENISLVYLLVVLWLASSFGRGPAIAASLLAFLTYDFLFIPPLYHFTVDDPAQWVSLSALLATALVLGQLTAAVRARAREAIESQRRTAALYSLAQLTASTADQEALLEALARRVAREFASLGVAGCALVLADARGLPVVRAISPAEGSAAEALSLGVRERAAQAAWVLRHGKAVGLPAGVAGVKATLYVPLRTSHHIAGALGLAGSAAIDRLALTTTGGASPDAPEGDPQIALFAAFCDSIALALERATLRQQAIHVEALRESDQLKDALLGSVTHDLRTPIAAIKAAAGSLLMPGVSRSEADRRECAEAIEQSADRLNRLVSNLLDLSRLEAGVAAPVADWHLIGDVIATVLDRLDLAGQTRGRASTVEGADDMPLVPLDHEQIEQVLTNLVENALKYSPADAAIRIRCRMVGPPSELEVGVIDQGIGIPPQEIGAIFDKFYRVQHTQMPGMTMRPPTGTGLGLAICAGIVRAHGGRIWAEGTPGKGAPGKGATVRFTLPLPDDRPRGALPPIAQPLAMGVDP